MLVKHNHSRLSIENILNPTRQISNYDIKYIGNCIQFKGVKKPLTEYVFGYYYSKYKNYYTKFKIKNIGNESFAVETPYQNNELKSDKILLPGESIEISRKNVDDGTCSWIYIYNLSDFDKIHVIKIVDFMITKDGFADVYLPNIETLPADKQPFLPPEGNYKEIIPNN